MFNYILAITTDQMNKIVAPITQFCSVLIPVLLTLVGSLGAIWVILLCVKFARADEPQEHEKAKKALKNAIIGFVLIFILLIMLQLGLNVFKDWWSNYQY